MKLHVSRFNKILGISTLRNYRERETESESVESKRAFLRILEHR